MLDGAMGTQLQARGMGSGECPEQWAREHPIDLAAIHAAYVEAGADILLTCTFGGSSLKLSRAGLAGETEAVNWALARVARDAAPDAILLGDMGPCDEMIEPLGDKTPDEVRRSFVRQAAGLADVVDGFLIETMSDVNETVLAIEAVRQTVPGKPILASMTFKKDFNGRTFHTIMGVDPEQAARRLTEAGADAVGCNCGYGIDDMIDIVSQMAAATSAPIVAEPNAGMPRLVGDRTVFDQTPEAMAAKVAQLVSAGARIVGGCCGTTPEHIAAMKAAIDAM
ncbi:MAG: homocysteine methyltransferase [Phycisphaerae bacterium]|nr:homocysteine methyltransferase [Phycisphaerae bacterium]